MREQQVAGYLAGPWAAYFLWKGTLGEWELLRRQFDALPPDESVESIEDILSAQFRRRFADLISQIAESDGTTGSINWRPRVGP